MKVVSREGNSLRFAVAELEHPLFQYRNVGVHAVPIVGRRHYYRTLKDRLDNSKSLYGDAALVINATVEDDFRPDSDSSRLGNGYWSDFAHVIDHSVLDETIPYTEYVSANLKCSELLHLMRTQKEKFIEAKDKTDAIFAEFESTYESKKSLGYLLGILLRYKYSSFYMSWMNFLYPKLYSRIAEETVNVLLSEVKQDTEVIHILVDPYAFNATVKALKGIGYKQYFDFTAPFITLV
jgi:hypothetical protein